MIDYDVFPGNQPPLKFNGPLSSKSPFDSRNGGQVFSPKWRSRMGPNEVTWKNLGRVSFG